MLVTGKKELIITASEDESSNNLNGAMVLPIPVLDCYYVLIKEDLDDCSFVETLFHEISHLIDYVSVSNQYCNGNYQNLPTYQNWLPFYFYSEYKAKRKGLEEMYKRYFEEFSLNTELGYFKEKLIPSYLNIYYQFSAAGLTNVHDTYNFVRIIACLNIMNSYLDVNQFTSINEQNKLKEIMAFWNRLYFAKYDDEIGILIRNFFSGYYSLNLE